MAAIHLILEEEEADFTWRDGQAYCEGYDLESEKAVLALTGFGTGVGVLLVAMNTCCKSETEFRSEVKRFVAGYKKISNPHIEEWPPGQLLFEYCSYSPDPLIRWSGVGDALLSERHYKRLLSQKEMKSKAWMARLPQLPEKYFYSLASLSRSDVNYALANNENCPIDLLEILAKDENFGVRRCVAQNLACTERILKLLAKDKDVWARFYVAGNHSCPGGILEKLSKDNDRDVRWHVAQNPSCPVKILELLAKDKDEWVRWKVTENLACSESLLKLLSRDIEDKVRLSAKARLAVSKGLEV